jgi:hypothetical protein
MKQEQFVLEWSKANNGFHIQSLADSLAWAQKCFLDDRPNQWVILMVGDKDTVHKMADNQRPKLAKRTPRLDPALAWVSGA